jgi:hypothetical protein
VKHLICEGFLLQRFLKEEKLKYGKSHKKAAFFSNHRKKIDIKSKKWYFEWLRTANARQSIFNL